MGSLSLSQVRQLSEYVHGLYGCTDLLEFRSRVVGSLSLVVPGLCAAYNEVDVGGGAERPDVTGVFDSDDWDVERLAALLARFQHEHPLIQRFIAEGDGQALKISDFLSVEQLGRTGLFNELYGPLDIQDQMSVGIPLTPSKFAGVVVNRTRRTFSEEDRDLMNLLRPHLEQAYWNAARLADLRREAEWLDRALEDAGRAVIRLDPAGRITHASPRALSWLRRHFPDADGRARLPAALRNWLQGQRRGAARDALPTVQAPLVVQSKGERLEIARAADAPGGSEVLVLKRSGPAAADSRPLERLGLTPREAEILFWVWQGKTNPEIGIILSISGRTAQKHLERVFQKLGVETRTAAALRAGEVLGGADGQGG